jgi:hypothetical protein
MWGGNQFMPKNLPYMQFYVRDWLSDPQLALCSLCTRGFWLEALCAMHISDTPTLSGSPEQLSRILRCSVAEVQSAVSDLKVTGAATILERNGSISITSRRRLKQYELSRLRANAGALGGSKTAAKYQHDIQQTSVSVSDSDSQIPGNGDARGKGAEEPPGFARFWEAWPPNVTGKYERKVNRAGCLKRWVSLGLEEKTDQIVDAVQRCIKFHTGWARGFAPLPMTFLNQSQWETAPMPPSAGIFVEDN